MTIKLTQLSIEGFKSIRKLDSFVPGDLTVLIGANGAGKSNLIAFFRMLSHMLSSPLGLQAHLTQTGRAHSWLHDGPSRTSEIRARLEVQSDKGINNYEFGLEYSAKDTLYFNHERYLFTPNDQSAGLPTNLGSGHNESILRQKADSGEEAPQVIRRLIREFSVYQFHNTSFTSRMRQDWEAGDKRGLKEDGANLGAFLLGLKSNEKTLIYYRRIVEALRQCLPFFYDFELNIESGMIGLQWRENDSDSVFSAHQASDGMLRLMALTTLLLQPPDFMPGFLILDEPELGLHPQAMTMISGLIKDASRRQQIMVATQSPGMLNEFNPSDVVVVERKERESLYKRLKKDDLKDWLDDFSMGELWEKNVIGGKPSCR